MELRQLRYFLAVAEHNNFTRAADAVHVSQPSLSVQIQTLEDELGAPLFNRLGRHIELTEAGRILLLHAKRVVQDLEHAKEAIREVAGGERGRLAIGTASTVNLYLVPPVVSQFRRHFPNVQLHIQSKPSIDIEQDLLDNQLDLGLCIFPVSNPRFVARKLFDETLCLVGPVSDRVLVTTNRLRMRELASLPLVLMPADYCLRKMVEHECRLAGVTPTVSVEMTSPEGIIEAIMHGAGWSILPEFYVRHRVTARALRIVRLYDPVPRHPIGLVHVANRHIGIAAQEFMNLCRSVIKEMKLDIAASEKKAS